MAGLRIALAALPAVALTLVAQEQTPAAAPTIRATVNEVALDLVVRDKHGKLVKNLGPGDVKIYEDGVLQQMRSFRLATGGAIEQNGTTTTPAAPAAAAKASQPIELRKANLVCIVFHNQDNLDVSMKKFTIEAVEEFLQSNWQPDTWVGVFALGSRLNVLYPFSTNHADLLRAAARGFSGSTFQMARVAEAVLNGTANMDIVEGYAFQTAQGGGGGGKETLQTGTLNNAAILDVTETTGLAQSAQRGDLVDQQRQFGHIQGMQSIDQMKLLMNQLTQLPGHKTVLMLSAGLPSNGNPELFDAVLNLARKGDISVYALDTNGLTQNSNTLAANQAVQYTASLSKQQGVITDDNMPVNGRQVTSIGRVGQTAELARQDDYVHNAVRSSDSQAPLRALSEGTGGFLIGGGNDLRKPFEHLYEDIGTHYEAVYRPTADKYDGHLRHIEVKVNRPDLTVESRKGYFAVPDLGTGPLMPYETAGLMALDTKPAPHNFGFRAASYQFRPETAGGQVGLALEVPATNLTAIEQPEQKAHRLHVTVMALVKDASGQIVGKFSQDSPFEIPDDKLDVLHTLPITWTHPFELGPGHYTVDMAVVDREGNHASTSTLPLDVAERKGLGLSSVMLVRRMAPAGNEIDTANPFEITQGRVVPLLDHDVPKEGQQYAYFVVYPDKSSTDNAMLGIEFLVDGKLVAQKTTDLPAPDATGAVPMLLGAMVQPGHCELRITATQGYAMSTQSVKYTVAAQ
ncbi:MAG TPA: VWA domain-containing protein [Bryobacteraceae bacterium]|nr:VWA domain-containing protein [Bryobacteraceae bacterium]